LLSRRALLAGAMTLSACGFTPAYAPGAPAAELVGRIALAVPNDKGGFDLVSRLEERLGPAATPLFRLDYKITTTSTGVAVTTDGAVTRFNVTGTVAWSLVELSTGTTKLSGQADAFTSYSATGSTIAGLAAEEDSAVRLMVILADQIVTRIIAASPQLVP
jgi:LPS-assembly lipoprotein